MDMKTQTAWIIIGVAVVAGAAFLALGGQPNGHASHADQRFIEEMIVHHEGAIEMATVALEKSTRPEVLSLAQGIIAAQTKEIADMRTWYRDWFQSEVPAPLEGSHTMHMQGMVGDMEKLRAAKDFDSEFVSQMIVHHEMAIMMAQMLQSTTERAEMKSLADNIISSQQNEIESMRTWLKAWYSEAN
jgi:uncharacterized protein (DUF305 family)